MTSRIKSDAVIYSIECLDCNFKKNTWLMNLVQSKNKFTNIRGI